MDEQHFNELVTSIKQAGQFLRGEFEPSRTFYFDAPDVKTIREKTGLSPDLWNLLKEAILLKGELRQ
jgi:putative transcriptional regulator